MGLLFASLFHTINGIRVRDSIFGWLAEYIFVCLEIMIIHLSLHLPSSQAALIKQAGFFWIQTIQYKELVSLETWWLTATVAHSSQTAYQIMAPYRWAVRFQLFKMCGQTQGQSVNISTLWFIQQVCPRITHSTTHMFGARHLCIPWDTFVKEKGEEASLKQWRILNMFCGLN